MKILALIIAMSIPVLLVCLHVSESNLELQWIDGDTYKKDGVRYRLKTCDTPETWRPECYAELEFGKKVTQHVIEKLNSSPYNVIQHNTRGYYDRPLVSIYLSDEDQTLCDYLISKKMANPYPPKSTNIDWCNNNE